MSDVPLRSDLDRMVDRYLGELASALQRLPVPERDHLLIEIREHITELRAERAPRDAWDMEVLLNRVGLPEDIAAAALENVDDSDVVDDVVGQAQAASPAPAASPDPDPLPVVSTATATPVQPWFRRSRLLVGLVAAAIVLVVAVSVVATHHGNVVNSSDTPSLVPATHPALPPTPSRVTVPNVIGLSVAQATAELQATDLSVGSISGSSNAAPAGQVLSQSPVGGSFMVPGSTVTLEVSSGPPL